jgi:hypothetical protein
MLIFSVLTIPLSQLPKRCEMLVGGVILKAICTIVQIILADVVRFPLDHRNNKFYSLANSFLSGYLLLETTGTT